MMHGGNCYLVHIALTRILVWESRCKDELLWMRNTSRLFQPLYAFEITLTFLDTIFTGFRRRLSIASLIVNLVEEMWWKMTRLLDIEWECNGVPKKGLADNTSKMPTSNRNTALQQSLEWGGEKDSATVPYAPVYSHKGKVMDAHPPKVSFAWKKKKWTKMPISFAELHATHLGRLLMLTLP